MLNSPLLKLLMAMGFFISLTTNGFAQEMSVKDKEVFNTSCVKTWMEKTDPNVDQVDYKDFGEKYCQCASLQPLNSDAEMDKAAAFCLSQTILQTTMATLIDKQGLTNLTLDQVQTTCNAKWALLNTTPTTEAKASFNAYCQCASAKLVTLNQSRDSLTDKDYENRISDIAKTCVDQLALPDSTTTSDTTSKTTTTTPDSSTTTSDTTPKTTTTTQ